MQIPNWSKPAPALLVTFYVIAVITAVAVFASYKLHIHPHVQKPDVRNTEITGSEFFGFSNGGGNYAIKSKTLKTTSKMQDELGMVDIKYTPSASQADAFIDIASPTCTLDSSKSYIKCTDAAAQFTNGYSIFAPSLSINLKNANSSSSVRATVKHSDILSIASDTLFYDQPSNMLEFKGNTETTLKNFVKDLTIHVKSSSIKIDNNYNIADYVENVVMELGALELHCDKLSMIYQLNGSIPVPKNIQFGGNTKIIKKDGSYATSNGGVYVIDSHTILLSDNAILFTKEGTPMACTEISYHIDSDILKVLGTEKKPDALGAEESKQKDLQPKESALLNKTGKGDA